MNVIKTHIPYWMICNVGTLMRNTYARHYPRHLVLAQLWRDSIPYRDAISSMQRSHGTEIILDNGAHEGELVTDDCYLEVIQELNPNIIVLPDLIGQSGSISIERSLEFCQKLDKRGFYGPGGLMIPCQGLTPPNVVDAYSHAMATLDPKRFIIGFGQSYKVFEESPEVRGLNVQEEDARFKLMKRVLQHYKAPEFRFHILGGRWKASRKFVETVWRNDEYIIRFTGLDSIKPCTCSLNEIMYPNRPISPVDRRSMNSATIHKLVYNVAAFCDAYGLINIP